MDVKVGSRVIVERHQDMANSNLSLDYKKGLVIGTYQESHWGGVHVETYYVICLDRLYIFPVQLVLVDMPFFDVDHYVNYRRSLPDFRV